MIKYQGDGENSPLRGCLSSIIVLCVCKREGGSVSSSRLNTLWYIHSFHDSSPLSCLYKALVESLCTYRCPRMICYIRLYKLYSRRSTAELSQKTNDARTLISKPDNPPVSDPQTRSPPAHEVPPPQLPPSRHSPNRTHPSSMPSRSIRRH